MFITFQMSSEKSKSKFYLSCGKRIFDLILTLTTLILLSPVFIIATLLVRVQLGRPVLFKQIRPGLHKKTFCHFYHTRIENLEMMNI
jgi:undecaprenyl phosphate N,N'-diacetylbacillosamine 1-phosphate transferase